jgi:hypothetical protein
LLHGFLTSYGDAFGAYLPSFLLLANIADLAVYSDISPQRIQDFTKPPSELVPRGFAGDQQELYDASAYSGTAVLNSD